MSRHRLLRAACVAAALLVPGALRAQLTVVAPPDSVAADLAIARARRAVSEGNTAEARRVLDSLARAADAGSPRLPEVLYWRATYAATAADAERDYRRLVVEHPSSPRAEDALLRLAQLEMARGDQQLAIRHLERLVLEHPESPNRARARYWMGRAWVDAGDVPKACDAFGDAMAMAAAGDVELRNQVRFAGSRCPKGWDVAKAAASAPAPAQVAVVTPPAAAPAPVKPASDTGKWEGFVGDSAAKPAPAAPKPAAVDTPRVATPAPAKPAVVDTPRVATPAPAAPAVAGKPAAAPLGRTTYAVQLAAYDTRADAESLVRRLAARGITARVSGEVKPFRVRTGQFATRAQAAQRLAELKQKGFAGFVAEEAAGKP